MDASPARLIVERTARDDVQTRQIILSVDGDPWVTLLYGESASRDIAPGRHRLRANNTLVWKTVELRSSVWARSMSLWTASRILPDGARPAIFSFHR